MSPEQTEDESEVKNGSTLTPFGREKIALNRGRVSVSRSSTVLSRLVLFPTLSALAALSSRIELIDDERAPAASHDLCPRKLLQRFQ